MNDIDYNLVKWMNLNKEGKAWGEQEHQDETGTYTKDLSQEQLAEVVGVTRQTIGLIEAGNYNPTLKLCIAICKALDRSLNDIFGRNKGEQDKD